MRTLGLDHVSLTVADLDRSVAFYHDLLGIPRRDGQWCQFDFRP